MASSPTSWRLPEKLRARKAALGIESLEERQMLSTASLPSLVAPTPARPDKPYDPSHILVRFRDSATTIKGPEVLAGTEVSPELGLVKGLRSVSLSKGVTVEQALAAYCVQSSVLYVQPDYIVQSMGLPNDPSFTNGSQWDLRNTGQNGGRSGADINAAGAWNITTGNKSVTVAVIDSGIDYNHPDLASNIWTNPGEVPGDGRDNDGNGFIDDVHGFNFITNTGDVMDDFFHGTHVAGTIGAVGNNSRGISGVAWNVNLMALKFLDSNGSGTTSNAIRALNYAVQMGADISNNSWNGGAYDQTFYEAIQNAGSRGHLFVASAGNFGMNTDGNPSYPASYDLDNIISVAATDRYDQIGSFSDYGSYSVDLAAPGVDILSTTPNNTYSTYWGTSQAAPHVAGAAALLWASDPSLSVSEVKQRILGGTDYIGNIGSNASRPTVTNGRLDVANSLKPDLTWNSVTAPGTVAAGQSFTFGRQFHISGSSATASFAISYYRSADASFGNDTLLGSETISGGKLVGNYNGNSPSFSIGTGGTYYLFAKLDAGSSLSEFDENNNVSQPIRITVGSSGGGGSTLPSASITDVSLTEGNSGTKSAIFTVTLSAASSQTVTIDYATADGTARAGSDYTAKSGRLSFSAGQTSKTITVSITGDTAKESNETFLVNLSNPVRVTLAKTAGTGSILDDDGTTAGSIASDGFGYRAVAAAYESIDLAAGQSGVNTLLAAGDDDVAALSLGTNRFTFYGVQYSQLYVSVNGLITLGSGDHTWDEYDNTALVSGPPQAAIAPLWDDWINTNGYPVLLYQFQDNTGDGKADRLILQWNRFQAYGGSPWTQTFQTILQLNTGTTSADITFNYYFLASQDGHANGATSTIGIKSDNSQGGYQMQISFNSTNANVGNNKAIKITTSSGASSASGTLTKAAPTDELFASDSIQDRKLPFAKSVLGILAASDNWTHDEPIWKPVGRISAKSS